MVVPPDGIRRTQRIGAYAVIVRGDALLLTRISARGFPSGWWGLPGGGIDHGEPPLVALHRELHEETGLTVRGARLVDIHDVRTQALGRGDRWEDYHGIHLLWAVDVNPDISPHVVERDGTTDEVRWVSLDQLRPDERGNVELGSILPVVSHVVERIDQFVAGAAAAGTADTLG